jgi:hypothetical protein
VDDVENLVVQLRDRLITQLRCRQSSIEVFRQHQALARVNMALIPIVGVVISIVARLL